MENLIMTKSRKASTKSANETNHNQENEFFNLKTTGIGYVNYLEERESSKDGELFTTCTIAALVGPKNAEKRQYRYINVVVVGEETLDLLWSYQQALEEERKVLVRFCVNDIKAKAFKRDKNEIDASLQATLYAIEKIWLDGELDYTSSEDTDNDETEDDEDKPAKGRSANRQSPRSSSSNKKGTSKRRSS